MALVFPATLSKTFLRIGRSSTTDKYGICLITVKTNGKKFPNKFKNPNPSTIIPMIGRLHKTKAIPAKKHIDPRRVWDLVKSATVRCSPIENATPAMNRIFPIF